VLTRQFGHTLKMHASPETIKIKYLKLWASYYCYRQRGPFLVVYGSDLADSENDGPCGACPFSYLRIYHLDKQGKVGEEVQSRMKEHRYVSIDDEEFIEKTWEPCQLPKFKGWSMIFKEEDKDLDAKKKVEADFEQMRGKSAWDKYIENYNQKRDTLALS